MTVLAVAGEVSWATEPAMDALTSCIVSMPTECTLGQVFVSSTSRFMVAESDPVSALPQHCPARPTDRRTSNSFARGTDC
ncbi:hypothetical protein [Streptomyces canus]|uniref:hypothetical protein n=1 Tax=Streptomyces canus TaxID=58343 RepID=UPI00324ABEC0